jgi:hypothetical protein
MQGIIHSGLGGDGGGEWTEVVKAADESVAASTTLQNDNELLFATVDGAVYEIEAVIVYASPVGGATPAIKVAYGEDATVRGAMVDIGINTSNVATTGVSSANQTSTSAFGTAAGNRSFKHTGVYIGAGGTFRLLWAQNVSNAGATIVRAGSVLRYRRIL